MNNGHGWRTRVLGLTSEGRFANNNDVQTAERTVVPAAPANQSFTTVTGYAAKASNQRKYQADVDNMMNSAGIRPACSSIETALMLHASTEESGLKRGIKERPCCPSIRSDITGELLVSGTNKTSLEIPRVCFPQSCPGWLRQTLDMPSKDSVRFCSLGGLSLTLTCRAGRSTVDTQEPLTWLHSDPCCSEGLLRILR